MARNILFYPTLDKKLLESLNCRIDEFQASYIANQESSELRCEFEEESGAKYLSVIDDTGRWSPDSYNFSIEGVLQLHNVQSLFENEGVVPEGCTVGIGMVWKSKTSNVRGAETIGAFKKTHGELKFPFRKVFGRASLRGTVELSFQLFIKETGNDCELPAGISLGDLFMVTIILEGINSTFTVFEKSAPGEPLWTVDCNWDDPGYDPFAECVRVTINTAHPAWSLTVDEDVRKELLKEIMASSMQIVISELSEEHLDLSEEYTPGSVCDAITYIIGRADLKMDSAGSLAKSIREYLDKSMK